MWQSIGVLRPSEQNSLHLIHRHLVVPPVIQRCGARRLVRRHLLSDLTTSAILDVLGDPSGSECVMSDLRRDPRRTVRKRWLFGSSLSLAAEMYSSK